MLSNVTLSAHTVACPTVKPEMMGRPITWKFAIALAVAVISLGLLALSVYRTAERWGWFYSIDRVPAPESNIGPDCETGAQQAAVK